MQSLGSWSGKGTKSQESIAVLEDGTAPLALKQELDFVWRLQSRIIVNGRKRELAIPKAEEKQRL